MPTLDDAIVACSCLKKWGSLSRAGHSEEMQDLEHATVASEVPTMVRHWQQGHRLRGRGGLVVWDLITRAATGYAKEST